MKRVSTAATAPGEIIFLQPEGQFLNIKTRLNNLYMTSSIKISGSSLPFTHRRWPKSAAGG